MFRGSTPDIPPVFQSLVPQPHYSPSVKLSDSDIMKMAMQTKTRLREEIEETLKNQDRFCSTIPAKTA